MGILNFPGMMAMGCTTITVTNAQFAATFIPVIPLAGQMGVAFWAGSTGIEIAGAGQSYGPTSITLINGVTTTLTFMNSNGSSLKLAPNGSGLPLFNTILEPTTFAGAPYLWLTASSTALSVRVTYFFNDGYLNQ